MNLVIKYAFINDEINMNIHFNETHNTLVTRGDNMQLDLVFLWLTKLSLIL